MDVQKYNTDARSTKSHETLQTSLLDPRFLQTFSPSSPPYSTQILHFTFVLLPSSFLKLYSVFLYNPYILHHFFLPTDLLQLSFRIMKLIRDRNRSCNNLRNHGEMEHSFHHSSQIRKSLPSHLPSFFLSSFPYTVWFSLCIFSKLLRFFLHFFLQLFILSFLFFLPSFHFSSFFLTSSHHLSHLLFLLCVLFDSSYTSCIDNRAVKKAIWISECVNLKRKILNEWSIKTSSIMQICKCPWKVVVRHLTFNWKHISSFTSKSSWSNILKIWHQQSCTYRKDPVCWKKNKKGEKQTIDQSWHWSNNVKENGFWKWMKGVRMIDSRKCIRTACESHNPIQWPFARHSKRPRH